MLKPALSRGELQCIGATTLDEYRKYIEKDSALARRFQEIIVDPTSKDETIEILKGLRERYEEHHRVQITDDAVAAAGAIDDLERITGRRDEAVELLNVQRDIRANRHRPGHVELVVIGRVVARGRAAKLDFAFPTQTLYTIPQGD